MKLSFSVSAKNRKSSLPLHSWHYLQFLSFSSLLFHHFGIIFEKVGTISTSHKEPFSFQGIRFVAKHISVCKEKRKRVHKNDSLWKYFSFRLVPVENAHKYFSRSISVEEIWKKILSLNGADILHLNIFPTEISSIKKSDFFFLTFSAEKAAENLKKKLCLQLWRSSRQTGDNTPFEVTGLLWTLLCLIRTPTPGSI